MLQSLTFVVVFAHNLLLEVNRSDDEKKWLNSKRMISHLFKETMAERPQETEFEVWVVEDNDLAGL
jgi:type IV secretory pathway VirD2 relaxase